MKRKSHLLFSLFLSPFSFKTMAAETVVKEKKRKRSSSSKNQSAKGGTGKEKREALVFFTTSRRRPAATDNWCFIRSRPSSSHQSARIHLSLARCAYRVTLLTWTHKN